MANLQSIFASDEIVEAVDTDGIDVAAAGQDMRRLYEAEGRDPAQAEMTSALAMAGKRMLDDSSFRENYATLASLLDRFAAVPQVKEVLQAMTPKDPFEGMNKFHDPNTGLTTVTPRRGGRRPTSDPEAPHMDRRESEAARAQEYGEQEEAAARSAAKRQAAADVANDRARAKMSRVRKGPYSTTTADRLRAKLEASR